MWEIWANLLLPRALKSCPKSKKSPNLVTLPMMKNPHQIEEYFSLGQAVSRTLTFADQEWDELLGVEHPSVRV